MDRVDVVVAHAERAVVSAGDVFLKIDTHVARVDTELAAMRRAPIPTPTILWHRPPVLALQRVRGLSLSDLGGSGTTAASWQAAGAAARVLHEHPTSGTWRAWYGADDGFLDGERRWLIDRGLTSPEVVDAWRELAAVVRRQFDPVVIHGDFKADHVFVEEGLVTAVIDWADTTVMDPLFDLAVLTIDHPQRLDDVVAGYGREVDREVVRGWWAMRRLTGIRWHIEHGMDASGMVRSLETLVDLR